jgi:hypothetical protein
MILTAANEDISSLNRAGSVSLPLLTPSKASQSDAHNVIVRVTGDIQRPKTSFPRRLSGVFSNTLVVDRSFSYQDGLKTLFDGSFRVCIPS